MKRTIILILCVALFASALGLTFFTRTKKANAEVAAGNRAFAAQDYETALKHYSAAQTKASGQAEPLYNSANVYYRQQVLDKAQQALEQALAKPNRSVEEFIHFNLGNVAYLAKQFDVAVTQFESALRINPADQEAKYNLELALLQKQEQQNQQKDQQDQNQDQQKQDKQQNQQDQQDKQNQGQQSQQDQQQDQQGQQDQQNQDQQGQQDQQQQDQQGQQDQQNQDQQGQQDQQNQGQQDQQQGQNDQQNQQSQQGQAGQPQDQQPEQSNGQAAGQPQQGLTKEQARQLLTAVAGNSKTLMQKLQMIYNFPGGAPEKDW